MMINIFICVYMCLDRIGMENDPQGNMDLERDLEIRRIQVR